MEEANVQLQTLISQYSLDEGSEFKNVNPLSMRLQGMLDGKNATLIVTNLI